MGDDDDENDNEGDDKDSEKVNGIEVGEAEESLDGGDILTREKNDIDSFREVSQENFNESDYNNDLETSSKLQ